MRVNATESNKKPPQRIYLQWHGQDNDQGPVDLFDVTWHTDKVFSNDVLYVKAKRGPHNDTIRS